MLIMAVKPRRSISVERNITTVFGYTLFVITILAIVVFTVVPFGMFFFDPVALHFNIAVMLIALVAGAVLPTVVAYIIGDKVTHEKNKASHHYNGVLFGVAAYWLAQVFEIVRITSSVSIDDSLGVVSSSVMGAWPILATIIIMTFVAVTYAHTQKQKSSMFYHLPYQLVLIATVITFIVYIAFNQDYSSLQSTLFSTASLLIPFILVVVSYRVMRVKSQPRLERLSRAIVAMSMGGIAVSLAGQFISAMNVSLYTVTLLSWVIGVVVWLLYLVLVIKRRQQTN